MLIIVVELIQENGFSLNKEQERWVLIIMLSVTVVKLALVIYCRTFTNQIVKAHAQDHLFDVITNFTGLLAAFLANYIVDWIDPLGAIIMTAAPAFLQKLTFLCWNHHRAISQMDTVLAYTFGSHYFVEVDIVLPSNMPLREAHDIGEALQEKIELLPEVERAFVHLDYESNHPPEHSPSPINHEHARLDADHQISSVV
ncbi:hypothetical protein HPP92_019325 [Vanilla planifolia]|uniref:Cation efflux protein cytoplasmic domain-containing protein n=1 Tax=Vanilla planifolia TaxID=51239 RepID=A0A835UMT2_VANPL|nr:hypothetical protein HPP92_019325 [Vanilla planifolia]